MKKVLIAIGLLVAGLIGLIAVIVVIGLGQIDGIAKQAVERGGTYALQVDTTVEGVDVQLTKGSATMTGLNVANPEGFDTAHFLAMNSSSAAVDIQSINTDTIRMPEITLSGIDVILDRGQTPSNYNKILENLKRFESGDAPAEPSEGGKKMVISSLVIEDVTVRLANMPGISMAVGDVAVNIPRIELKDVGEKESMGPGEIINLVVKTVLAAAVEAGGGIIPGDVLGELSNGLAGLTSLSDMGIEAVGDLGKQIQDQIGGAAEQAEQVIDGVKNATDGVGSQVEDAAKGIKDLFGGNKNDDP